MTQTAAVSHRTDPTWLATKATFCRFIHAYWGALRSWGVVGLLLMLGHWSVYVLFGPESAKRLGIDTMLLGATGVGSFLVFAFYVALVLWAVYAIWRPRAVRAPALRITRWVWGTTTGAAGLFSGVAVVAIWPALRYHDQVADTLLGCVTVLVAMLFVVNWLLALVRSFARDRQGPAMAWIVLVGLIIIGAAWAAFRLHS